MTRCFILIVLFFAHCNSNTNKSKGDIAMRNLSKCDSSLLLEQSEKRPYTNHYLNQVVDTFSYNLCQYYHLKNRTTPLIYNLTGGKTKPITGDIDFDVLQIYAYDDIEEVWERVGGVFYISNDRLVIFSNLDMKGPDYFGNMISRIQSDFPAIQNLDSLKAKIITRRKYITRIFL